MTSVETRNGNIEPLNFLHTTFNKGTVKKSSLNLHRNSLNIFYIMMSFKTQKEQTKYEKRFFLI